MDHVLNLVQGASTIELGYGGSHLIRDYIPISPALSDEPLGSEALSDGGEFVYSTMRNVTESALIFFQGATVDAVRAEIRAVETMLRSAALYATQRKGSPVYVHFDPGNSGTVYRSQILSGRVEISNDFLDLQWSRKACEALITWTRRYFWEAAAETTLINGVQIYNHDDAGHHNHIDLLAANVGGVIPAPLRLELRNDEASATYGVWIAHNVFNNPTTLTHILEGEAASGVTSVADAGISSGDAYGRKALGASEADLYPWTLAAPAAYGGAYYRVLARFRAAPPAGTRVRLRVTLGGQTVWEMDSLVTLGTARLQEIATVQLPPAIGDVADVAAMVFVLRGLNASGGNLDVDYVQLSPTQSFRRLDVRVSPLASGAKLIDDGILDYLYTAAADGTGKGPNYVGSGPRPMLWPGRDQRLIFLQEDNTSAAVERRLTVYGYYRPRRLTL
jgi:hypothetical protein